MIRANVGCKLEVQDGKPWCRIHRAGHPTLDWSLHSLLHTVVNMSMNHMLYVAGYCTTCDNGCVLIDQEQ